MHAAVGRARRHERAGARVEHETGSARRGQLEDGPRVVHGGDAAKPGEPGGEFVPEVAAARHAEQGL